MSTSHVQPRQVRLPAAARGSSTIAIAAGLRHSVLLLKSGAVCTFGDHSHGQLGRLAPNRLNTCDVFPLDSSSSMATPSSMVMKPPSSEGMQEEPHQQDDAKPAGANDPSPSAGGASAAEEEEEEESGDGRNSTTMSAPPRIVAIAAGEVHTLALSSKGEVYSWGDNQLHQCARQVSSSS